MILTSMRIVNKFIARAGPALYKESVWPRIERRLQDVKM